MLAVPRAIHITKIYPLQASSAGRPQAMTERALGPPWTVAAPLTVVQACVDVHLAYIGSSVQATQSCLPYLILYTLEASFLLCKPLCSGEKAFSLQLPVAGCNPTFQ